MLCCVQLIRSLLQQARGNGFSVMRAWAHTVGTNYPLQTAPGVYNENIFRGLDYALDEARKNGVKVGNPIRVLMVGVRVGVGTLLRLG